MCGRYTNHAAFSEIKLAFKVERVQVGRDYAPSYNISPSYGPGFEQAIVVRGTDGRRELRLARWWFIPSFWSKPLKDLPTAFNARSEDLANKAFWKQAFRGQRCLVAATGWREFRALTAATGAKAGRHKQPYHFHQQGHCFAFAGLWSTWHAQPGEGEAVDSFAIVTTEANALAKPIHSRMPVVLPEALHGQWLDPNSDPAVILAQAISATPPAFEVYPSNPIANKSGFEGVEAIERVKLSEPAQTALPLEPKK